MVLLLSCSNPEWFPTKRQKWQIVYCSQIRYRCLSSNAENVIAFVHETLHHLTTKHNRQSYICGRMSRILLRPTQHNSERSLQCYRSFLHFYSKSGKVTKVVKVMQQIMHKPRTTRTVSVIEGVMLKFHLEQHDTRCLVEIISQLAHRQQLSFYSILI